MNHAGAKLRKIVFSKEDSIALKGLAIIMLVLFHTFGETSRFEGFPIDFSPFAQNTVVDVAHLCRICVSIFAFITGFGLLRSVARAAENNSIREWVVRRLIKTLSGFWFVFVICNIVSFLIDRRPVEVYFSQTTTAGVFYVINDFLGLANILNTPTLCSTWWYMSAAVVFIFLIPLVYVVKNKLGYLPIVVVLIVLPRTMQVGYPGGMNLYTFILPMVIGMAFADYDLFARIDMLHVKNDLLTYICRCIVFGSLVIFAFYIQQSHYDRLVAWELYFGLIPLFFILFFVFCVIQIPMLRRMLMFLGVHSMTIFLTHTFIRSIYLQDLVYGTFDNWILIFLLVFILSLALAVLLDMLKKVLRYDRLIRNLIDLVPRFPHFSA